MAFFKFRFPGFKAGADAVAAALRESQEEVGLASMHIEVLGQLPVEGQCIDLGEWLFEIVDLDARRIDKVLATRLA